MLEMGPELIYRIAEALGPNLNQWADSCGVASEHWCGKRSGLAGNLSESDRI